MATLKKGSYADRRWKLFEHALSAHPELEEKLLSIKLTSINDKLILDEKIKPVEVLVKEYGLPYSCAIAVALYVSNPKLKRQRYLDAIIPPIVIWDNKELKLKMGRYIEYSLANNLEQRVKHAKETGVVTFDTSKINYDELAKAIALSSMLEIGSNVTISELRDYIDDYWDDIEKAITLKDVVDEYSFAPALLGKVPQTKLKRTKDRDELIMKLADEGVSVKDTISQLVVADYAAEKTLTAANIRQIRYNQRKKKKSNLR